MWIFIGIGFGLIAFLAYGLLGIIQKKIYKKILKWNIGLEIVSILFFFLIYSLVSYVYYKSPIINGGMNFLGFFGYIILRMVLIITPIIVLARRYSDKLIPLSDKPIPIRNELITLKGENKLDILKIKKSELVCISNSQNYVEIFYLQKDELKTKLIRSSITKIEKNFDFLIRVHRSHLINPAHFKDWKNQNTIFLTQIEIPVSKNYRDRILSL